MVMTVAVLVRRAVVVVMIMTTAVVMDMVVIVRVAMMRMGIVAVIVLVIVRVVVMTVTIMTLMLARMIMMAMVMLAVSVTAVIMSRMIMRIMTRLAADIRSALGIERRLDLHDARAETTHHILDDMIAADTQPLGHQLRRQMTIAEMPCDANKLQRVGAFDLGERLGRGDHLDQAAVFQHQRIAAAQRHRFRQIEQELQPARAGHGHAPTMTVVEFQHDAVGRSLAPAAHWANGGRTHHLTILNA